MSTNAEQYGLIAVGTSAGGFEAICRLVRLIPSGFSVPLAVVQHRAKDSDGLASLLQDCTELKVCEVEDKQPIESHSIYIAPPDYHLLVDDQRFALSTEGPVGYSRPSIDVFFESAADSFGVRLIGMVLTGANADGAAGLERIVARGGRAIVQDPATAEVSVMPAAAKRAVPSARVLPLDRIPEYLVRLTGHAQPERHTA